jgi:hypothetical protein
MSVDNVQCFAVMLSCMSGLELLLNPRVLHHKEEVVCPFDLVALFKRLVLRNL